MKEEALVQERQINQGAIYTVESSRAILKTLEVASSVEGEMRGENRQFQNGPFIHSGNKFCLLSMGQALF